MALPNPDQPLVKVKRGPGRPRKVEPEEGKRAQRLQSMDDVAQRYHTPYDIIPGEGDPERRHKPTISVIELTSDGGGESTDLDDNELPRAPGQQSAAEAPPDTSDGVLRTLEDLMARFPFGDGQYYIYVKRLQPRAMHGVTMYGQQRNIKDRITIDEFIDIYGGGEYDLIPYGPPKRGGQTDESGRLIPKALAKPIRITIPWVGDYATPPSHDSVITSENEEEFEMHPMHDRQPFRGGRRQIETPASAKIHETELTFAERDKLRDREDRMAERQRVEREREGAVGAVTSVADKTIELLKEQLEEVRAELRESRSKPPGVTLEGISSLVSTMAPKSEPEELRRMREQHDSEIKRIEAAHKTALETLKSRHDDEMGRLRAAEREELSRAARRVEDLERESTKKVADAETRARADVERAQTEARKDLERQEKEYNRNLESSRRDHEREINNMRTQFDQQLQVERGSYERERMVMKELGTARVDTEKSVLNAEISTLKSELERTKAELAQAKRDLEQKGSLVKQLGEFSRVAEQMGFKKDEGGGGDGEGSEPMDWKAMIATGGVELVKNLPQVLAAATQALQARTQVPQQRAQMQQQYAPPPRQMSPVMPHQGQQPMWQTEETLDTTPLPESMQPRHTVPTMPIAPPPPAAFSQNDYGQPDFQPVTPPQQQMVPPPMQQAAQSQPPPVNERRRRRAAAQGAPPPAPAQAPPPAPGGVQISDDDIRTIQPQLEEAFASGQTPAQVAQHINQNFGAMGVSMGAQISAEAVAEALMRIGQAGSPLARREGQKFVRGLQAELVKIRDSQGVSS
jgi:hypothetical protein